MKRQYCSSTLSRKIKKNKLDAINSDSKESIELTLSIPQSSDLDYIEHNGLIITESIEEETTYAVDSGGSYLDEDDEIHIPLILLHNQKIACYLKLTISTITMNVSIDWIATAPALQGKGFAKLFLLTVLTQLNNYEIERVELNSSDEGMPLYLKCGFLPTDKKLLSFLDQEPDLLKAIAQIQNYIHANKKDESSSIDTDMFLDFTNGEWCQKILQNYLAENKGMLAKINIEPQVQMILKSICDIDNSVSSPKQETEQAHSFSYIPNPLVKTIFNRKKMNDEGLQFDFISEKPGV